MNSVKSAVMGLVAVCVVVWMVGLVPALVLNVAGHKSDCIENEGWIQGLLWCSSEGRSTPAVLLFQSVIWPASIAYYFLSAEEDGSSRAATAGPDIGSDRVGTAYICWGLANSSDRREDAGAFEALISRFKEMEEKGVPTHEEYMQAAGRSLIKLQEAGKAEEFYKRSCEGPASNIKRAVEKGLF